MTTTPEALPTLTTVLAVIASAEAPLEAKEVAARAARLEALPYDAAVVVRVSRLLRMLEAKGHAGCRPVEKRPGQAGRPPVAWFHVRPEPGATPPAPPSPAVPHV